MIAKVVVWVDGRCAILHTPGPPRPAHPFPTGRKGLSVCVSFIMKIYSCIVAFVEPLHAVVPVISTESVVFPSDAVSEDLVCAAPLQLS